ncbi:MAG TPA: c-type cytochrome [Sphingobacteriaceae bacterium]
MRKIGKILVFLVILLGVVVLGAISYVKLALPNVGDAPELKVEITKERVERGKYLANHVTVCIDCHSPRDWSKFSGPLDTTKIGIGGEKFDQKVGFPGEVYVPNITPYNLKHWTDGEIFRAITTGVKKDGSAIFPFMPYKYYARMDKEDIYSIIAYLRTLREQKTSFPERKLDFPLNVLVNTMPVPAAPGKRPSESNQLEYGRYLVNASACVECHSKNEKGEIIAGSEFGGGRVFQIPNGKLTTPNITPHKETGIGTWTKEMFINRFQQHADAANATAVGPKDFQTIMPWTMYGSMKQSDLEAIYAYLRTVKPIENNVVKFVQE